MFSMPFTIMQHIHIMHSFDMSALIAGEKQVRCIWGGGIRCPLIIEQFCCCFVTTYYTYQLTL